MGTHIGLCQRKLVISLMVAMKDMKTKANKKMVLAGILWSARGWGEAEISAS